MEYNDCVFSKLFICCNRISYYNQMLLFSQSLSQIKFYTELIEKELIELKKSRKYCENSFKISENDRFNYNDFSYNSKGTKPIQNNRYNEDNNMTRQKEFTLEELKKYDGSNGNPAYAAVSGIVYDVSYEATWAGGTHFGLYSGKDLSNEFLGCHKGMAEILNKLPKVGTIK
ncbi:TPA: cytochrome b5 domain-containing protein [Clostridium botulinum]|uniref:cytochrome b5 domain-containing protein n=1 Tax=Clostridium botulinum TaxID=1491 RepID=UPI00035BA789|nr:cytochrome b5 domain-containing protein [Clostridium botulinum]APH22327.1 cytochrome b5-like Heme/Steroid binding domain protein [Clostridium botulinum]APQ67952.1 cytochrome b5-like Heme/Steroid binding domain protein [Clostridium botulinum]EPS56352.1 heme/steroid binding domain-containing protein [Clostridium botulinum Af84]MBN3351807.1 hypothetical protein [Clostridium botulinum]MBN3359492.1 hypothetical protein [Clostridium botulinum]